MWNWFPGEGSFCCCCCCCCCCPCLGCSDPKFSQLYRHVSTELLQWPQVCYNCFVISSTCHSQIFFLPLTKNSPRKHVFISRHAFKFNHDHQGRFVSVKLKGDDCCIKFQRPYSVNVVWFRLALTTLFCQCCMIVLNSHQLFHQSIFFPLLIPTDLLILLYCLAL